MNPVQTRIAEVLAFIGMLDQWYVTMTGARAPDRSITCAWPREIHRLLHRRP